MNNDLLKRIDEWLSCGTFDTDDLDAAEHLLIKCRAEIATLHEVAQQQAVVIERLSKPYVPMTDDEWHEISAKWQEDTAKCMNKKNPKLPPFHLCIEAAVIKRLGLEIKHG